MQEEQALQQLREEIDQLDYKIHDLINERAKLALKISDIKVKYHGNEVEFYRPQREQSILARIKEYNKGPLDENRIADIFSVIMSHCRQLQVDRHQDKTS